MPQPGADTQPRNLHSYGYKERSNLFGGTGDENADGDTPSQYYGKYRATVVNNIDPLGQGRLLLTIPDVKGFLPSTWALPCVPSAGALMGMYVVPPPIGAGVWVEFEQGDPDYPVWVGCFWDPNPVPPGLAGYLAQLATKTPPGAPLVTVETSTAPGGPIAGMGVTAGAATMPGNPLPGAVTLYSGTGVPTASVTLAPGGVGIMLYVAPSTYVQLTSAGVQISAPTVAIQATTFTVNGAQFVVT
jgi:hypothetical protein